jgi:transposase
MQYTCFIGVDVSKGQLDIACLRNEKPVLFYTCKNDDAAVSSVFMKIFEELPLEIEQTLICAEHTGHYSNILMNCMVKNGYRFWLESPYQISKSQGIQRGKNDQVDAERIAIYARRFSDKAYLVKPGNTCIEALSYLASERNLLMTDLAKYKSQITDHKMFIDKHLFKDREKRLSGLIRLLQKQIKSIEHEMDMLVLQDETVKKQLSLLLSIDGVGKQVAFNMLIATKAFTRFETARKFACYVGVAPFQYTSGTSIRSAQRVSKQANQKLKSLIHMAALSVIQRQGELRDYYTRKVSAGKNKMSVINAVRAKLIGRMFAVINNDKEYEKKYSIALV